MNILVSACLLGLDCKYSGGNNLSPKVIKLMEKYNLIPVCPEQLGGLTTPRVPAEKFGEFVIDKNGKDITPYFYKGAEETLKISKLYHCSLAILKSKSPSCGFGQIYDGHFNNTLIKGNGITAEILQKSGITVICDEDIV